jgi:hypothetical protein
MKVRLREKTDRRIYDVLGFGCLGAYSPALVSWP